MSHPNKIKLEGVIPATLLAFDKDFQIDEKSSRKHIKTCALTDGISALTINGHSSEVHACDFEEQKRILNFSLDEVGDIIPIINGVYADGSIEAAKIARMSEDKWCICIIMFSSSKYVYGRASKARNGS